MGRGDTAKFDPSKYFTDAPAEGLIDTQQDVPENPKNIPEQAEQPTEQPADTDTGENVAHIEPLAQRREKQEITDMGYEVIAMADSMGDRRGYSAADLGVTNESLADPDIIDRLGRHTKFNTLPPHNRNALLRRIADTQRRMGINREAA